MNALWIIVRISRTQWPWLAAGILLGLLVIVANALLMALSGWFITAMAVAGTIGSPFNYQLPAAAIRALAIVRTISRYGERLVTHDAALRVLAQLRVWFFRKLIPLAPAGLEHYATGDLAGRLRVDVDALEQLYVRITAPLATGLLSLCFAIGFAACWSGAAALTLLLFLILTGVLLPLALHRIAEKPGQAATHHTAELRTSLTEGLDGIEELQILGAVEHHTRRVGDLSSRLVSTQQHLARISAIGQAAGSAFSGVTLACILLVAGTQVANGSLSGPALVMLLLFSAAQFEVTGQLATALQALPATVQSLRRILRIATTTPPCPEPDNPHTCPRKPVAIDFQNVTCSYAPGLTALSGFNLSLAAGERVALVGPSGSGKSTIIELLLRFRPYNGQIFYGNTELGQLADDTVRHLVAALPQNPHLLNTTLRENILLARPEATEDELNEALRDAGLADWIATLPDGLATEVGEGGYCVSGGEARRIALARTLLQDAPVLLLDEPTEGLDSETEQMLVARLAKRISGKTVLLASHRPACLALVERVVTLAAGNSAEK